MAFRDSTAGTVGMERRRSARERIEDERPLLSLPTARMSESVGETGRGSLFPENRETDAATPVHQNTASGPGSGGLRQFLHADVGPQSNAKETACGCSESSRWSGRAVPGREAGIRRRRLRRIEPWRRGFPGPGCRRRRDGGRDQVRGCALCRFPGARRFDDGDDSLGGVRVRLLAQAFGVDRGGTRTDSCATRSTSSAWRAWKSGVTSR